MGTHGTVEHFQSFDVDVLHRMGALREPLVSYPMVSFRWPTLVRLTANRWRVDVQFRCGAVQTVPVVWTRCHFGGAAPGTSVNAIAGWKSFTPQERLCDAGAALTCGTHRSAEAKKAGGIFER